MIRHLARALLLALLLAGGGQFWAATAQAAVADDVRQALAVHAGDTDSAALSAEIAAIIANAADPAVAAAEAIAALGDNASAVALKAVGEAVESTPGITPEALAQALGAVIANGGANAETIAANVIGVAGYLGPDNSQAAGKGLAIAVSQLEGNPALAGVAGRIVALVEASNSDALKGAYSQAANEITSGVTTTGGNTLLQQEQNQRADQSPN